MKVKLVIDLKVQLDSSQILFPWHILFYPYSLSPLEFSRILPGLPRFLSKFDTHRLPPLHSGSPVSEKPLDLTFVRRCNKSEVHDRRGDSCEETTKPRFFFGGVGSPVKDCFFFFNGLGGEGEVSNKTSSVKISCNGGFECLDDVSFFFKGMTFWKKMFASYIDFCNFKHDEWKGHSKVGQLISLCDSLPKSNSFPSSTKIVDSPKELL